MAHILIIGYGNPLRSDDGLGWHAARQLREMMKEGDAEVLTCQQLTPELAEAASRASMVFFIDARRDGNPGEISCFPVAPQYSEVAFTHELSPTSLLGFSQALYGNSPPAFVVSVTGENFEHGEELTPRVAGSVPYLIALIGELTARYDSVSREAVGHAYA
jgi:hydrogenase maturation protease